jgi:hypothetical protein
MAMGLLQAGVDRAVIALWLGHESVETTQIYLEANLALKEDSGKDRAARRKARPLPAWRRVATNQCAGTQYSRTLQQSLLESPGIVQNPA